MVYFVFLVGEYGGVWSVLCIWGYFVVVCVVLVMGLNGFFLLRGNVAVNVSLLVNMSWMLSVVLKYLCAGSFWVIVLLSRFGFSSFG